MESQSFSFEQTWTNFLRRRYKRLNIIKSDLLIQFPSVYGKLIMIRKIIIHFIFESARSEKKEATALDEETRVRILVSKLSNTFFKRYLDIILPNKPSDFSFHQTINKLTKHFDQSISTFQTRYNCLKTTKIQEIVLHHMGQWVWYTVADLALDAPL